MLREQLEDRRRRQTVWERTSEREGEQIIAHRLSSAAQPLFHMQTSLHSEITGFHEILQTVTYFSKEIKQYISNRVCRLREAGTLCWEKGFKRESWRKASKSTDVNPYLERVQNQSKMKISLLEFSSHS